VASACNWQQVGAKIYRYRIVPIDYTAKGMLATPMMPAATGSETSPQ